MPARIVSNDIPKGVREPVALAISDAIGRREGDWKVKIQDVPEKDAWDVRIEGPDDFVWTHRFQGVERDETIIRNSVRVAIEMAVGGLSVALAELALQGITFISETKPDGRTEYTIDRVTLKDEEVMELAQKGALTRDGIRNYLVNR